MTQRSVQKICAGPAGIFRQAGVLFPLSLLLAFFALTALCLPPEKISREGTQWSHSLSDTARDFDCGGAASRLRSGFSGSLRISARGTSSRPHHFQPRLWQETACTAQLFTGVSRRGERMFLRSGPVEWLQLFLRFSAPARAAPLAA